MKSYELQTYRNGKWTIRDVFNQKDIALFEAKRCVEEYRYPGVRVIEENYRAATNNNTVRTIFNGALADKWDKASQQEANAARRKTRQTSVRRLKAIGSASGMRKGRKSRGINYIKITLFLFLIVVAGLAALTGLQEYFLFR